MANTHTTTLTRQEIIAQLPPLSDLPPVRRKAGGPKYHRGSVFGPGTRRVPKGRQLDFTRKRIVAARDNGKLTKTGAAVMFMALGFLNRETGQCNPTKSTIARKAGCSERTAHDALRDAKRLGLIGWNNRIVRTDGHTEQTSNQYWFPQPPGMAEPHEAPAIDAPPSKQGDTVSIKINLPGLTATVRPLHRALASLGAAVKARGL